MEISRNHTFTSVPRYVHFSHESEKDRSIGMRNDFTACNMHAPRHKKLVKDGAEIKQWGCYHNSEELS